MHPRTSWFGYYTRFNGGLLSTLTYVSLYYLIVEYFNAKQLIKLVKTGILVGGLVALYAIPEHFGVSSCLLITKTVGVSCWVQDVQSRVFGTFGQPNWLAAYLITLLPLVTAWLAITKKTLSKLGLSLLWLMFLAGVLFTQSRSGILGLGIGVGIWLFLTLWSWFWQPKLTETQPHISFRKKFQTNWIWIGLSLGGLGLIGWFGTPFSPNLANLWSKSFNSTPNLNLPIKAAAQTGTKLDVGGTESGEIRKIDWSGALAVWRRYPVFGSGVETFAYSYYQDRPLNHNNVSEWDFLYNKAHNELLNYLATSGLVGLGSYLALWED
jgi:O-antigen ligase